MTGTLPVTPGETLNLVVGGYGGNGTECGLGAGGGGGSFIYTTADLSGVLAAAGCGAFGAGGGSQNEPGGGAGGYSGGGGGHYNGNNGGGGGSYFAGDLTGAIANPAGGNGFITI